MPRRLLTLTLLLVPLAAHAHWTGNDLPDWAQRGKLRWALHYSRADRKLVDLFLQHNQTVLQGSTFDSPETAAYARDHGLRHMPYVCSRTLTVQEMERNPQLKGAVVIKQDGSEFWAYNNPVRRYGSLHAPAWPEFVRERTRRVWDQPGVAAIFYDNAFFTGDDHNPAAVEAWKKWAAAQGLAPGTDVPPINSDPLAAASRWFSTESLSDYHRGLQQFCRSHTARLLNSPNLGSGSAAGLQAIEDGAVDLVFYETATHPPFDNNLYLYKVGLASSHGRPTGMLAYLPPEIGDQRGEKTWHEGMHHFFYPSSPIAEEFALAAAEGAATGGSYIPCYNLFPSLPITDLTDPFNKRIYRALEQSYAFLTTNEDLYVKAEPVSSIAILHSNPTNLHNRRLQNGEELADALIAAGVPFEVVVASDLPDGLGPTRTLIVPNVTYLDARTAEGLLRFVEQGGRAIVTGQYGSFDLLGRPLQAAAVQKIQDALGLVQTPVRQWTLDNMEFEGAEHVRVKAGTGSASTPFAGKAGQYVAYISIDDENDGASDVVLSAGGKPVFETKLDVDPNVVRVIRTTPFSIRPGDLMQVTVRTDGGEMGRLHAVLLVRAEAEQGARLGRGTIMYHPQGLETLAADRLVELLAPPVRLPQPAKLAMNVTAAAGLQAIHLLNYDFGYEVEKPGLYASDDGKPEARMFYGNDQMVIRKRLRIEKPGEVVEPMLQVYGLAVAGTVAEFPVTINGKPAGSFSADQFKGQNWVELPIDPALLQQDNVIEMAARGDLDGKQKWIQISIDMSTNAGASEFSTDGGKTFSSADLSTDRQAQTGEYLVRILDKSPGMPKGDPGNLARNPGFEQVKVPHSETKLTVVPARNVAVGVQGKPSAALAISPEAEPVWLSGTAGGGGTTYVVPEVSIYTVLLLGPSREALEPVRQAQLRARTWAIPPVTEPLRALATGWEPFGAGFELAAGAGRGGSGAITCRNESVADVRGAVQQLDFGDKPAVKLTLTAWSRCQDVSAPANPDYSLYVDATCADGTVYNGRATLFATGSHDWQQVTLKLDPPSPLRTAKVYLLFRKKTGQAWFDDVTVKAE